MESLRQTALRITAYVMARVRGAESKGELERLQIAPKQQANLEILGVFAALFALALIGASFGWIGLGLYFLLVFILFY
ncbi:MAG: hypothetical protein AAGF56_05170 [Pseudomonadota bacterium]